MNQSVSPQSEKSDEHSLASSIKSTSSDANDKFGKLDSNKKLKQNYENTIREWTVCKDVETDESGSEDLINGKLMDKDSLELKRSDSEDEADDSFITNQSQVSIDEKYMHFSRFQNVVEKKHGEKTSVAENQYLIMLLKNDIQRCKRLITNGKVRVIDKVINFQVVCPYADLFCRHRMSATMYCKVINFFEKLQFEMELNAYEEYEVNDYLHQYNVLWKESVDKFIDIRDCHKKMFIDIIRSLLKL